MKTKFDIGETAYLKVKVNKIIIDKNEIRYFVNANAPYMLDGLMVEGDMLNKIERETDEKCR